jgi:oxygen-dependent protoporphyrinogen oxidase
LAKVVVIGGGITGLAAAWELQQHGIDYVLLEAADRWGGKLSTEYVEGFILERGADSFLATKPWAVQLAEEIGFADSLVETNLNQRSVYLYRRGALHPFPRGMRLIVPVDEAAFLETAGVLSEDGKRRMLEEAYIPARLDSPDGNDTACTVPMPEQDESLASFVRRRFGEEALEVFGSSLLSGIHVGDPETLSIQSTFPEYPAMERTYGSLIRGMRTRVGEPPAQARYKSAFVSPRDGMGTFPEAIAARLHGDLRLSSPVQSIRADRTVQLVSGERIQAESVILTTATTQAARLLRTDFAEAAALGDRFRANSSAIVTLGFARDAIDHPLDGYGFVIPRGEPTHATACTWSSTKLPGRAPAGMVLLRLFFGGSGWRAADLKLPDDAFIKLALDELKLTMQVSANPRLARVFRWQAASPQYEVGHPARVRAFEAAVPAWVRVAGCALNGVGVPDCVRQGRESVRVGMGLGVAGNAR